MSYVWKLTATHNTPEYICATSFNSISRRYTSTRHMLHRPTDLAATSFVLDLAPRSKDHPHVNAIPLTWATVHAQGYTKIKKIMEHF